MKQSRKIFSVTAALALTGFSPLLGAQTRVATSHPDAIAARADTALLRRSSVAIDEPSLERAIRALSKQTKIILQYQSETLERHTRPVSVRMQNATIRSILEAVLSGTSLQIRPLANGQIGIVDTGQSRTAAQSPATGIIRGIVTDSATGKRLVGVSISLAGRPSSTVTDKEGAFILRDLTPGDYTMIVKLLGYRQLSQAVTVRSNAEQSMRFVLVPSTTMLSGVVTTATGLQERIKVGNDIAKINVPELLKNAPVTTMSELLTNRVPGLIVQKTSGAVGSPSVLRIRGNSSISLNNDPIIIVDGVRVYSTVTAAHDQSIVSGDLAPSPLDGIDPNSVETVEVLRGPSAAALYGTDAANGIIVITTKRGQPGPTRWSVSTRQGLSTLPGKYPILYRLWGTSDVGVVGLCTLAGSIGSDLKNVLCTRYDSLQQFQLLNDSRTTLLGRGSSQAYSLGMNGGGTTVRYGVTLTSDDRLGFAQMPTSEVERVERTTGARVPKWQRRPNSVSNLGGTSRMDIRVSETADVGLTASLSRQITRSTPLVNALSQYFRIPDPSDSLITLDRVKNFRTRDEASRTVNRFSVNGTWRPQSRLTAMLDLGWEQTDGNQRSLLRRGDCPTCQVNPSNGMLNPLPITANSAPDSRGNYLGRQSNDDVISFRSHITYRLPDWIISGATTIGVNYQEATGRQATVTANDLATGSNSFVGAGLVGVNGQSRDSRVAGIMINQGIRLFNTIYQEFGVRLDRGSGLGPSASLPTYPKLNFSIPVVTDDRPWGQINMFRIRTAYGHSGNQPSITSRLRTFQQVVLDGKGSARPGLSINTIGNTILRPERGVEFEGGVDLGVWNDRVVIGFTGYHKKTRDLLISIGVPPSVAGGPGLTGYSQEKNLGDVLNAGLETTVDLRPVETGTVSWGIHGIMAINRERLISIARDMVPNLRTPSQIVRSTSILSSSGQFHVIGYPLNGWWGKPLATFSDVNGDGLLSTSEIRLSDTAVYLGSQYPKFTAGLTNTLGLFAGRITIMSTFEIQSGATQINGTLGDFSTGVASPTLRVLNDTLSSLADRAATLSGVAFVNRVSSVRWSELSISAQLPARVTRVLRGRSGSVALQGSNLRLWSSYTGKDPNMRSRFDNTTDAASNSVVRFSGSGQLPQSRDFLLRVDLQW